MGKSSAPSAANAVCDHVRDMWLGTEEGILSSIAVISDGNPYGVPEGLIYSFPCKFQNKEWEIVANLPTESVQEKMQASAQELIEEKAMAFKE